MGKFSRKLFATVLAVIFSFSLAWGHEDQETLDKYQTLALEFSRGYEAYLDMETFLPTEPPGHDLRELTEEDIQELAAWRSKDGIPWTTWVYEDEPTLESKAAHSTRKWAAVHTFPNEVYEKFHYFLLGLKGIVFTEEEKQNFVETFEMPARYTGQEFNFTQFELSRWFRENVSTNIIDATTAAAETYAWYSSPSYKKGSLPPELESALESIGKEDLPDWVSEFPEYLQQWGERALLLIRSGEIKGGHGPYFASPSDMEFLQRDQRVKELDYYRELLSIVSDLGENPDQFSEFENQFQEALENFPGPQESFIVLWGKGSIDDYEFLQGHLGEPDDTPLGLEAQDRTLGEARARIADNLSGYREDIEAFIERWSALESSGD